MRQELWKLKGMSQQKSEFDDRWSFQCVQFPCREPSAAKEWEEPQKRGRNGATQGFRVGTDTSRGLQKGCSNGFKGFLFSWHEYKPLRDGGGAREELKTWSCYGRQWRSGICLSILDVKKFYQHQPKHSDTKQIIIILNRHYFNYFYSVWIFVLSLWYYSFFFFILFKNYLLKTSRFRIVNLALLSSSIKFSDSLLKISCTS